MLRKLTNLMSRVLRSTRHKIGHFADAKCSSRKGHGVSPGEERKGCGKTDLWKRNVVSPRRVFNRFQRL